MAQAPILFLSHSGADTNAARELKRQILSADKAKEANLSVWFDNDELEPGEDWQARLEKVIDSEATAFAVYVGSNGIVNWVEREVRLGLSRATGQNPIPFIPILTAQCEGSSALPPFARQHHAVRDPLSDRDELARLISTVLRTGTKAKPKILDEPFVGLRAMGEDDSLRFYGRDDEIAEVLLKLKQHRLVAIVAESGSGKSSLARAGIVPAIQGQCTGRQPAGWNRMTASGIPW